MLTTRQIKIEDRLWAYYEWAVEHSVNADTKYFAELAIWSFYRNSIGTWALNRGLHLYH